MSAPKRCGILSIPALQRPKTIGNRPRLRRFAHFRLELSLPDQIRSVDGAAQLLMKLHRSNAGATAIEYGLIAALIAVAAIAAMQGLGSQLSTTFGTTSSSMSA